MRYRSIKSHTVQARMSDAEWSKLVEMAQKTDNTLSDLIRFAVREYIADREGDEDDEW